MNFKWAFKTIKNFEHNNFHFAQNFSNIYLGHTYLQQIYMHSEKN